MAKAIYLIDVNLKEAKEKDLFGFLRLIGFNKVGIWFNGASQRSYVTYASIKNKEDEEEIKKLLAEKIEDFTMRIVEIDEFSEY